MAAVTAEQYNAARTLLKIKAAKDDFLTFCQIISPDPNSPDDPDVSQFQIAPHHRLIGEALMKVQSGECLRLAISMPPQHGKSEQISRLFPAWYMGKDPQLGHLPSSSLFTYSGFYCWLHAPYCGSDQSLVWIHSA